jgi:hypothetical protein
MRATNVDDDSIGIERIRDESGIDHEGRSMQCLRGPENRTPKGMRDHNVVSNFDGEQGGSL